ncbi:MAG: sigma-54-dependent transcriptional regulator [Syntrophobacteraceae bacterium]
MKVLAVDDEQTALASLSRLLERHGIWDVEPCLSGEDAVSLIKSKEFDIVLLDLLMPGLDGIGVLEAAKPFRPSTEFIIITAVGDLSTAVKTIRLGAYDYLVKPVDNSRLLLTIERAYERKGLRRGLAGIASFRNAKEVPPEFGAIKTRSRRMLELLEYAAVMARSTLPILVTGESGTGKELLARGVHEAGPNPDGPFVAVNAAAVPEGLFESQFFGYLKGAFTGGQRDFKGYFEQANGGTLFLDEIGEVPPNLQVKLLRAIEEKRVTRIGSTRPVPVDVRIVSATNSDLDRACQEGRFRLDLLYRLKSAHIHLPPLREREGDIPYLADHFLAVSVRRGPKALKGFAPQAIAALCGLRFEGNVRELAQMVERAVLIAQGDCVTREDLGLPDSTADLSCVPESRGVLCSLKENEEIYVVSVLRRMNGNRARTAEILGITVRQLQRKIARIKENPRWAEIAQTL